MYPIITIAGHSIYTMWLISILGILAALGFVLASERRFGQQQVDVTNAGALGLVGAVAGGKILYLITAAPILWRGRDLLAQDPKLLVQLVMSGTVYYGGLLGFLLAAQWYCRRYSLDARAFWDLYTPAIPLFHTFGRIGCFFNGCCHGVVSSRFGIAFTHSLGSENGVPYVPVPLMEAAGNLILFCILAPYSRRHKGEGKSLPLYLACYAGMRFCLEWLRGDTVRGIWLGLSTSQWISLLILLGLAVRSVQKRRLWTA